MAINACGEFKIYSYLEYIRKESTQDYFYLSLFHKNVWNNKDHHNKTMGAPSVQHMQPGNETIHGRSCPWLIYETKVLQKTFPTLPFLWNGTHLSLQKVRAGRVKYREHEWCKCSCQFY